MHAAGAEVKAKIDGRYVKSRIEHGVNTTGGKLMTYKVTILEGPREGAVDYVLAGLVRKP